MTAAVREPALLLFDHPLSPYAQKVRMLLREKGLAFAVTIPDALGSGEDTGYSTHNPRLEVPALQVAGRTLFDSTVICEYLEDAHPRPALRPADPLDRARARTIEDVCDTHYEAVTWGLGEMAFFGRALDRDEALRAAAARELAALNSWLETQLSPRGWLVGESFGWADLAAAAFVNMAQLLGAGPAKGSRLDTWLDRAASRQSVAATIAEAACAVAGMKHYAGLMAAGNFRRQFRDHRLEWMIRAGGIDVVSEGLKRGNVRFTDLGVFGREPTAEVALLPEPNAS